MGKKQNPQRKQGYAIIFREETDDGRNEISPDAYTYILSVIKYGSMTTKDMDSTQLGYPKCC